MEYSWVDTESSQVRYKSVIFELLKGSFFNLQSQQGKYFYAFM